MCLCTNHLHRFAILQVDDHLGDLRHELEGFDTDYETKFLEVSQYLHSLENACLTLPQCFLRICTFQAAAVMPASWDLRH